MSRTHAPSSYGFRSFGIAGFVVALSFFINTAPALAQSYTGGESSGSGSETSRSSGYGAFGGLSGDKSLTASADQLKNLQERIKKLDEMKAQLEKLLLSLQQRASTTPQKPACPVALGRLFGGVSTSTSHDKCRPVIQLPHPILCPAGSRAEMSFGGTGTTTPSCRPNRDDSHSTSTCTTPRCAADWGGGMNPGNHGSTTLKTPYGNPTGWSERVASSSKIWFQGRGGSFGGGSAGNGQSYSQVLGASSDMSAEVAGTLDSLKSDLLDISDILNQ